jgi:uncharacterized protein GlcG (DUF336 family)
MSRIVLAFAIAFALSAPPAVAADIVTVHRLSDTLAGEAVLAVITACHSATVVVVDSDGVQQAALRGDTSSVFHLEAAYDKAYTAVTTRDDTSALLPRQQAGRLPPVMTRPLEHLMVAQGGIVVKVGDETVAGIGVSGSPSGGQGDEDCARAGLNRIRDRLKT